MVRMNGILAVFTLLVGLRALAAPPWASVLAHEPAPSPAEGMSPELKAFLAAEDLDDVGDARASIKSVAAADKAAIRGILKEWKNQQAVANLLIHADLIPEEDRLATLFRGLAERRVDYYVVAAIIGLGEINRDKLSAEDRTRLRNTLLTILRETSDVRAKRASLAFTAFVSATDAPQIIALMEHPDETVRNNLRAWLFETFKDRGIKEHAAAAGKSGLPEKTQHRLVAEFEEFVKDPRRKDQEIKTHVLFAYIPNLKEYEPQDAAGYCERGGAYHQHRDYDRAILNYTEALRLDPKSTLTCNNLAWLLATCPVDKVRNGRRAKEYARKACALTEEMDPSYLATLAAACAECGEFEDAVIWMKKALARAGLDDKALTAFRDRLKLYEMHKPYRQP
jgi:tetratricopeptide (TPR) repeat protein